MSSDTPDSSANPPASTTSQDAEPRRIRIGTQRPGAEIPRVEQRVKFVSSEKVEPPVAVPVAKAPAPALPSTPSDVIVPTDPTAVQVTSAVEATTAAVAEVGLEAVTVVAPSKKSNEQFIRQGEHIPKPNLRAALSPDLQSELDDAMSDLSFDDMLGPEGKGKTTPAADLIEAEERRKGTVLSISRDLVFFDLGSRNQGFIQLKHFPQPPVVGAVLDIIVSRFDPEEGLYELTMQGGAVSVADWSQVHEGMVVDARVSGHNKGGLECEVNNLKGFMPISQIALYRVENIEQFVGQKWPCLVTEANPERRNLLLSRRAVLEREQQETKEKTFAELEVGQIREGTVRNLREFGAFVDLGGIDGLIHIGQMSWDRIKHPSEVLELNQKVQVKIEKIDPITRKIGLSYRDLTENPWTNVASKYTVGGVVQGTVTRIMEFGAFLRLEPGVEGLVHISEIAHGRVFRVADFLQEGQTLEAKIQAIDVENQRISLSIRALMAKPVPIKKEEPELPPEPETPPPPIRQSKVPLKGGTSRKAGGDQFGLKW